MGQSSGGLELAKALEDLADVTLGEPLHDELQVLLVVHVGRAGVPGVR